MKHMESVPEMTTEGGSTQDCHKESLPTTTSTYSGINLKPTLNRIIKSTGGAS